MDIIREDLRLYGMDYLSYWRTSIDELRSMMGPPPVCKCTVCGLEGELYSAKDPYPLEFTGGAHNCYDR